MAPRTHVLLVHEDGPADPAAVAPHIAARLSRKGMTSLPFRWMRRLWARVLAWWRARTLAPALAQLPGPSPRPAELSAQATALQKVLGARYRCHGVLHDGQPDAARAAAEIGKGDHVVLVPMDPLVGPAMRPALSRAKAAVARAGAAVTWTGAWAGDEGWREAMAEVLRLAIQDRAQTGDYAVVLVASGDGAGASADRAREAARDLARRLRLRRPCTVGFLPDLGTHPRLEGALADTLPANASGLVVAHLGATSDHRDTVLTLDRVLAHVAEARGQAWCRARPPGTRPTFIHALAGVVQAAERDAGWTVPEDRIRADVAAEWAARDARAEE
jgi:protoheme ferro-lyase